MRVTRLTRTAGNVMTRHQSLSLATALAGALAAPAVLADGQPSGTAISNSISVVYESGGDQIELPGVASADFTVDQRVSFAFAALDDSATVNVEPGASAQEIRFLLTNTGNEPVPFDIDIEALEDQLGLTFDPAGDGAEGTYSVFLQPEEGGEATSFDPNGTVATPAVAVDGSLIVVVRATIPRSASDGQLTALRATATPLAPGGGGPQGAVTGQGLDGIDIVYGDDGGDGTEQGEVSYQVLAPLLSAMKDVIVVSENRAGGFSCGNGPPEPGAEAFIPGACVEYTITLSNAPEASSPATTLSFNDTLPENVTYDAIAANNGFDNVEVADGVISGTVGSLVPGASATVRVRATVN
ncbi:conserved repeat domain-containing protein [Tranquillimonas rosea]|uniref:Conserved repeat domain-containing protein n=2 Tax=Tranquillimonas rosea TaxID=641238 RepID=A0A1H9SPH0_9RHOB|nr:conserved repeat domain-containing protein [Tranquillimonas rosea]